MHTLYYIILGLSTFLFASLTLYVAYLVLRQSDWFDQPNERSNHARAVPTGAGIAFIPIALGFLVVANAPENLLWGALLLSIVSFLDDRHSLPVSRRLGVQLIAVLLALGTIKGPVLQGLFPLWFDYLCAGLLWLWFINLFNFMDGIDEITVSETGSICLGLAALGLILADLPRGIAIDAVIIGAAALAFYPWNKHPATLFMGDAGSVPLGYLLGYLLLSLAGAGYWHAALILPAYYLTDSGVTLLRRALKGKPVWKAHSEHLYQKAVRSGLSHAQVAGRIRVLNLLLIALACASGFSDWADPALLAAYGITAAFCLWLPRSKPRLSADAAAA